MAEYVDRKAAIEALKKDVMGGLNYESILNRIPSADVQPVKHGQWLDSTYKYSEYNYDCSVCGCNEYRQVGKNGRYRAFKYCPECGSKMDEDGET